MNYVRHLNGFFERLAEDERLSSYHISLYLALFQHWNANRFSDQFTISRTEVMQLARIGSANTYARCIKELTDWGYIKYLPTSNLHSGSKVTCTRFDIGSDTTGNTATDTGIESDTASDIATGTTIDTGTSGDLKSDTGTDTTTDTGSDRADRTGSIASAENDTGRSTATREDGPTGIQSDTGTDTAGDTGIKTDTASDTLFINKNKLKEEESSKRNSKEKVSGEEEKPGRNVETKTRTPEFGVIRHFFEQNHSSTDEAQKFYAHYQSSGWKTADMKTIVSWQAIARKWIENNQNNRTDEREFNKVRTGKLSVTVNKNYDEPL